METNAFVRFMIVYNDGDVFDLELEVMDLIDEVGNRSLRLQCV